MANSTEVTKLVLDASNFMTEMKKVLELTLKEATAFSDVSKTLGTLTDAIKANTSSLTQQGTASKKVVDASDKIASANIKTKESVKKVTEALAGQQAVATAVGDKLQRLGKGVYTNANEEEIILYKQRVKRLKDYLLKNQYTYDTVKGMIDKFVKEGASEYKIISGETAKLQQLVWNTSSAYKNLGAESKKALDALALKATNEATAKLEKAALEASKKAKADQRVSDSAAKQAVSDAKAAKLREENKELTKRAAIERQLSRMMDSAIAEDRKRTIAAKELLATKERYSARVKEVALIEQQMLASTSAARASANVAEKTAYAIRLAALKDFALKNNIAANDVAKVWKDLSNIGVSSLTGTMGKLQTNLMAMKKATEGLGAASRKTAEDIAAANKKAIDTAASQKIKDINDQIKAAKELAAANKIAAEKVANKAAQKVERRLLSDLRADETRLAAAIRASEKAERDRAKAIRQSDEAAKGLNITWRSFARQAVSNMISRSISSITSNLRQAFLSAVEFDKAIASISTIDRLGAPFSTWTAGIRELSDSFGTDALDQAKGTYQALSNQVADGANVFRFMASANRLAVSGLASTEDTVKLLSSAINAFGFNVFDTERISAVFFKTVELGRVVVSEMGDAFGRVAVPAAQLGLSFEEVTAAVARLTVQGIKYDVSSTFLRNVILSFIKPTEAMSKALLDLGYFTGEAAVKGIGFSNLLGKIDERTSGAADEIGVLFSRIRSITGYMGLAAGGLDKYNRILEEMKTASATYGDKVKIVLESSGKNYERLMTKIANFFKIDIATPLLIGLNKITEGFTNLDRSVDNSGTHIEDLFPKLRDLGFYASKGFLDISRYLNLIDAKNYNRTIDDLSKTFSNIDRQLAESNKKRLADNKTIEDQLQVDLEKTRKSYELMSRLRENTDKQALRLNAAAVKAIKARTIEDVKGLATIRDASILDNRGKLKIAEQNYDNQKEVLDRYAEYVKTSKKQIAETSLEKGYDLFDWTMGFKRTEEQIKVIDTEIKRLKGEKITLVATADIAGVDAVNKRIDELTKKNEKLKHLDEDTLSKKKDLLELAQRANLQERNDLQTINTKIEKYKAAKLLETDPSYARALEQMESLKSRIRERAGQQDLAFNRVEIQNKMDLRNPEMELGKLRDEESKRRQEINARDITDSQALIGIAEAKKISQKSVVKDLQDIVTSLKSYDTVLGNIDIAASFDVDRPQVFDTALRKLNNSLAETSVRLKALDQDTSGLAKMQAILGNLTLDKGTFDNIKSSQDGIIAGAKTLKEFLKDQETLLQLNQAKWANTRKILNNIQADIVQTSESRGLEKILPDLSGKTDELKRFKDILARIGVSPNAEDVTSLTNYFMGFEKSESTLKSFDSSTKSLYDHLHELSGMLLMGTNDNSSGLASILKDMADQSQRLNDISVERSVLTKQGVSSEQRQSSIVDVQNQIHDLELIKGAAEEKIATSNKLFNELRQTIADKDTGDRFKAMYPKMPDEEFTRFKLIIAGLSNKTPIPDLGVLAGLHLDYFDKAAAANADASEGMRETLKLFDDVLGKGNLFAKETPEYISGITSRVELLTQALETMKVNLEILKTIPSNEPPRGIPAVPSEWSAPKKETGITTETSSTSISKFAIENMNTLPEKIAKVLLTVGNITYSAPGRDQAAAKTYTMMPDDPMPYKWQPRTDSRLGVSPKTPVPVTATSGTKIINEKVISTIDKNTMAIERTGKTYDQVTEQLMAKYGLTVNPNQPSIDELRAAAAYRNPTLPDGSLDIRKYITLTEKRLAEIEIYRTKTQETADYAKKINFNAQPAYDELGFQRTQLQYTKGIPGSSVSPAMGTTNIGTKVDKQEQNNITFYVNNTESPVNLDANMATDLVKRTLAAIDRNSRINPTRRIQ